MKSWWIRTENERIVLDMRDAPVPQPKAGEILVRVHASAMNRGELIAGVGLHAADTTSIGGSEAAGEVAAVGAGVSAFKSCARNPRNSA